MALSAGSVSIAANGAVTKSGAAGRLYDKLNARLVAKLAAFGQTIPVGPDAVPVLTGIADLANDISSWLVTELTTNATAKIGSAVGALQKTPSPNDPNVATAAPGADKFLPIV